MNKKNYDYYKKLIQLAEYTLMASSLLKESLTSYSLRNFEKKIKEMHTIEENCDSLRHEILSQLAIEFITPIDREDIIHLSQLLDDIVDCIESVVIKIHMYQVSRIRPETERFVKLIDECCQSLKEALQEFSNFRKSGRLHKQIIRVNESKGCMEALYTNTIHQLFCNSKNTVELIIWSDLFLQLKQCAISCENAADMLELIVIKNL